MPASKHQPPRFKTIQSFQTDYAPVNITQYESTRTGLRIAVVDRKGPKVEGEFALATEITDNSGAPHTLEHLVFMGSKSYRYTGLLDKLSSRAFSTTNAGTAVDYTSYSLKTAGWEGFSQILPVYLEHLIVPTMTDAACYTEVHHIDGTGHDAGVVYSEMQGRENTPGDLIELQRRVLMYPEGNGFRSETGGMTKELRVLTPDRIRAYHKEMYQPKNLRVIITGEVDHDELLQIMDDFESTIVNDVPALNDPFRRPWVDSKPTPKLTETKVETIRFPEEDESMGEITVGWIGPSCNDSVANAALSVILFYLADSPISVLENVLVEKESLASGIYYETETRPDVVIWFYLTAVETDKLQDVYRRLLEVLQEVADKPLDMRYLSECLKRERRQLKERAESSEDFFTQPVIEDHLFGSRDGQNLQDLKDLSELDVVEHWSEAQWKKAFRELFIDNHHVCVLGVPSKQLSEENTKQEEARVKAQQERLGQEGLEKLAERLEEAKAENGKPIPEEMLEQFPVPRPESVKFMPTTTARSGSARKMGELDNDVQKVVDKADDGLPLFIHFEHIPSNFLRVKLYLGTAAIPEELRPVLSLYLANFFTTPVTRDGKRIEFEDLVAELDKETVAYAVRSSYGNQQMLTLSFRTEPESYETVISQIRTVLFDSIHDPVRLHASLTKLLADIPSEKREGDAMAWAVNAMISTTRTANRRAMNVLTKTLYLKRLRKLLKQDEEAVIGKLQTLCQSLHRPENFRIYVAGDITKLPNPITSWRKLTDGMDLSRPLNPLDETKPTISETGKKPGSAAYIVPITAIDSSYLVLTGQGPDDWEHADLPALMVAIAFFRAVEGPLWTSVRGTGLAYGATIRRAVDLGKLHFYIDRSPDCYKAFVAARSEISDYASGAKAFKTLAIQSAVGEIVFEMADEAPTMGAAADESFINQVLRGVSKDYAQALLAKIGKVGVEEVKEVTNRYLVPLFKPETANLVATCAGSMKEKMVEGFSREGFQVEAKSLEDFQDDYGLAEPEGEDDDEDDEDEDGESQDGEDEDEDEDENMDDDK
ncbi:related to metalloprotease 1 [Lecanosticta acicola]|uniref:Related to metalloprotease 1 n=1 Tax=Lecanosticta acicola TaxID=111012 RepID=A0AAI8YT45_9PEZI|nr:related to metalloprotease 1 [Lecanosticta acicola]